MESLFYEMCTIITTVKVSTEPDLSCVTAGRSDEGLAVWEK